MPPVPVRRPAAPPPAPVQGANFGASSFYAGGFLLPEGDYAMEHNVIMHQPLKQDGTPAGPERLGVMLTAYPLSGGEPLQQFLSMGTKAHLSWAPHPNTGKGIVPIPGGANAPLTDKSNWFLYKKSMEDCGLPEGIFTDDISVLDGIWVHTTNVPEPEERKSFGAKTGEVQEERKGNGLIPVVGEIKDNGKPWENTGGFDFAAAPAPKAAPKAVARPAAAPARPVARPAARPAPVAQVEEVAPAGDEDLMTAALNGIGDVLGLPAHANGCTKLLLRTNTFKAVAKAADEATANQVLASFFSSDEALNSVLEQLGYSVVGGQVKPVAA